MGTWVFDVDGCLIDALSGSSLRPGASDLLSKLNSDGHTMMLWSAGGDAYAERRAKEHGIDGHFFGFFGKEERDADGFYLTHHLPGVDEKTVFIDDHPEDLNPALQVVSVRSYLVASRHDRELLNLLASLDQARSTPERCPPTVCCAGSRPTDPSSERLGTVTPPDQFT